MWDSIWRFGKNVPPEGKSCHHCVQLSLSSRSGCIAAQIPPEEMLIYYHPGKNQLAQAKAWFCHRLQIRLVGAWFGQAVHGALTQGGNQ